MSIINSQPLIGASGNQVTGYNLTRSLRFRSSASAYLSRVPASAGNRQKWTFSAWVKRGTLGVGNVIFSNDNGAATNGYTPIYFNSDNNFVIAATDDNATTTINLVTTQVFRDPSAWYHIVVAFDTTQATASNRVKLYVNGSQVTSFSSSQYPTQNYNAHINRATSTTLGVLNYTGTFGFYDGYMAEVHFINDQQLDASSFGETDTATGVWKPKRYTGTYGTNGFYLPFSLNQTASHSASFNGSSQYLSFPNSSNFAFGTGAFTIEGWFNGSSGQSDKFILGGRSAIGTMHITTGGASGSTAGALRYVGSSTITSGTALVSSGSWNHWAVTRDGSNNVKLWINGQEVGSGTDTTNYSTTSGTWYVATNDLGAGSNLLSGNLSNLRIVKGSAVYTAKFAPPSANLTAISGTSLLTLQSSTIVDNSGNSVSITNTGSIAMSVDYPFSSNVSYDASGNNNNWVANNISLTSGATYDSMKDVPTLTDADTANYAVLNPLVTSPNPNGTITNGNLLYTGTSVATSTYATLGVSSDKFYFEATLTALPASGIVFIGVVPYVYNVANLRAYRHDTGEYYNGSAWSSYGASYTTNDVIGVAVDMTNQTLEFYKNGVSQGQKTSIGLTGLEVSPYFFINISPGAFAANFGQRPFAYTPPSGFKALNTFNLPTPTIGATASTQANDYFDVSLYTGAGTTQSITNSGSFSPDLVWLKSRSAASSSHYVYDSVRGVLKSLSTNQTETEQDIAQTLTSFNSDGFTLGTIGGNINGSGITFAAWQWRGSDSAAVSNTSGTITSTVSANTTAGFSIVTYTGNSVQSATVGHGLGVAPSMILIKRRNTTAQDWGVYHTSIGKKLLQLNTNSALWNSAADYWYDLPSSTVFYPDNLFTDNYQNISGAQYVAYCFAEVAGYSKFGSYTGNGSTDGPFIYTGFRPRFYLYKRTDTTASWVILDAQRNTANIVTNILAPNLTNAESSFDMVDFCSNGIKIRNNFNADNGSGGTFIYAAFAENPFKYSLAR